MLTGELIKNAIYHIAISHWMKQMMPTELYFRKMICSSKKVENLQYMFLHYSVYPSIVIVSNRNLGILTMSYRGASGDSHM